MRNTFPFNTPAHRGWQFKMPAAMRTDHHPAMSFTRNNRSPGASHYLSATYTFPPLCAMTSVTCTAVPFALGYPWHHFQGAAYSEHRHRHRQGVGEGVSPSISP